jgi:hypothetical protein
MHAVIAVEPAGINNWADLRYILEKFGFSKGALIARYPNSWMLMVIESCRANKVGDIEMARIVEKLTQVKLDRLYRPGFEYDGNSGWIDNVLQQEVINNLDAVLVKPPKDDAMLVKSPKDDAVLVKSPKDNDKLYSVDAVPEALFDNRREVRVKRKAIALASAAAYVLIDAHTLVLVDSYQLPRRKCIKVLDAFIKQSRINGSGLKRIIIHSAFRQNPVSAEKLKAQYQRLLHARLDEGVTFTFCRWNNDALDFDFHARYLLSVKTGNALKAGLRFDRGFVEPEDHGEREHMTDVVCMEPATVEKMLAQYANDETSDKLRDQIFLEK